MSPVRRTIDQHQLPYATNTVRSQAHNKPTKQRTNNTTHQLLNNQRRIQMTNTLLTESPTAEAATRKHDPHRGGGFDAQPDVPRPSHAERVRTLVHTAGRATLSTIARDPAGFPFGSLVTVLVDDTGAPWVLISEMAEHTANASADHRASILIAEDAPLGSDPLALARVTLIGNLVRQTPPDNVRACFLTANPGARHYVDFPDFSWWTLEVSALRYVGGFGRMSWVSETDYRSASPDPIAPHQIGICAHMNEDHEHTHAPLLNFFLERSDVRSAVMTGVDRLGCDFDAITDGGRYPLRLPFGEPVSSSEAVREALVAMLHQTR
jgi:heme iron utilization protein